MASRPPVSVINNEDAEFAAAFDEFAAGNAPAIEPTQQAEPSEGNAPADDSGATAPLDAAETGTSEQTTGAPAPATEAPDPWAAFPDEARAALAALARERDEFRHRATSDANRVSALSRKLNSLTNGSAVVAPPEKPKQDDAAKAALDAKVATLREEYPEIAEPIIEMLEATRAELSSVQGVVGRVEAERNAAAEAAARQALAEVHPDYEQIAVDPVFGQWLQAQPETIQRLANSWDARETSAALSLFKADVATSQSPAPVATVAAAATDTRRSQQLDGGRDIRSRPAPAASGVPDDFEAAFQIEVAKRAEKARLATR